MEKTAGSGEHGADFAIRERDRFDHERTTVVQPRTTRTSSTETTTGAGSRRRYATEVELHSKANDRLMSILCGYRWQMDRGVLSNVGYVTTRPAVGRNVQRQAASAMLSNRLELITLDEIAMVRKRIAASEGSIG